MGETRAYIIDPTTGEIVDALNYGDRILRSQSIDKLAKEEEVTAKSPIKHFTKQNNDELSLILAELNNIEVKFLIGCMCHLGYEDNCVKNVRGEPMPIADIGERIGLSRASAFRAADGLMEKHILCKAENKREMQYYICPMIAGRGTKYNKVLQTMFRHYKVRSKGNKEWAKLLGG